MWYRCRKAAELESSKKWEALSCYAFTTATELTSTSLEIRMHQSSLASLVVLWSPRRLLRDSMCLLLS
jgi:hypothetical protein